MPQDLSFDGNPYHSCRWLGFIFSQRFKKRTKFTKKPVRASVKTVMDPDIVFVTLHSLPLTL
jgi:hypothetical protein